MKKTEAIRIASKAVSSPIGGGTSWCLYGPYHANNLSGPSTESRASSYFHARAKRTEWVAYIALVQMGYESCDAGGELQTAISNGHTTVDGMVAHCIAHLSTAA